MVAARRQPTSAWRINRKNPITAGIAFAIVPGLGIDLVSGTSVVQSGAMTRQGGSLVLAGSSNNGLMLGSGALLGSLQNSSVIAIASAPALGKALYCERAASGNDIYKLENLNGGTTFTYRNDGGSISQFGTGNNQVVDGRTRIFGAVKNGATHTAYCALIGPDTTYAPALATSSFGGNAAFSNSGLQRTIGYDAGDSGANATGRLDIVIGWTRSITAAELDSLRQNPYQIAVAPEEDILSTAFALHSTATAVSSVAIAGAWLEQGDSTSLQAAASVVGAIAGNEFSDALSASASVGNAASASWAEQADTLSLSSLVQVVAVASLTDATDGLSAQAVAQASAAISWGESSDSVLASAQARVSLLASTAEDNDSASIQAAASAACSAAFSEASDTASLAVSVGSAVAVLATWTEVSDTASVSVVANVSGSATWAEQSDSAAVAITVGSAPTITAQWSEANDTLAVSVLVRVNASVGWTEASDGASMAGVVGNAVLAAASLGESSDQFAALATVTVAASAGWAEASDLSGFSAAVLASAGLTWAESADALVLVGHTATPTTALLTWGEAPDACSIHAQSSGQALARAPAGSGYAPQSHYNESRPATTSAARPPATQRNCR
jgi:hypothetical protein